jgi:hypothetical protein
VEKSGKQEGAEGANGSKDDAAKAAESPAAEEVTQLVTANAALA